MGSEGEFYFTQEDRENHFHVLGSTGEGKSRFLQMMACQDIDRIRSKKENGPGLVFIDGSEEGDTIKKILGYCEKVGFKKVLLINPDSHLTHKKVTPLNPIHTNVSHINKGVFYLTDAFRAIWNVEEPGKQAVIENYMPAIFKILATTGLTLTDLEYFMDYEQVARRQDILDRATDSHAVHKVRYAYKNPTNYKNEVGSTMRRIEPVFKDDGLKKIFIHRKGVDFAKLIAERWVILVDVSEMDIIPGRLLASVVINEIVFGLKRLRNNGWKGYEYLYIDEAHRYATNQIADILSRKRKLGLRMILSHQHMGQMVDNPKVVSAIKSDAKIKIAFYVRDNDERKKVVSMMYGGKIDRDEVEYALSQQHQQNAVVQLPKGDARIIRIHDTPTYEPSEEFISKIYSYPWYYTEQELTKDQYERFGHKPKNTKSTRPSGTPHRETNNRDDVSPGLQARRASQEREVRGEPEVPKGDESPEAPGGVWSSKF